jgi:hypothetical protein
MINPYTFFFLQMIANNKSQQHHTIIKKKAIQIEWLFFCSYCLII